MDEGIRIAQSSRRYLMQLWLGEREAWAIEGHWRGTAAGASAPFSTLRTTAPASTAGKRAGSQGFAASLGPGNVNSDINMAKYLHFLLLLYCTPGKRSSPAWDTLTLGNVPPMGPAIGRLGGKQFEGAEVVLKLTGSTRLTSGRHE
ncbi:hypothetical protein CFIO01_05922 [Colletotrichum fioriniae PJ7]|uniref:Uncharacterized protein n=1 Tax=Colletotrichum fioriniae PJ7 TaxID=1445577 RepID=A0A010R0C7_9PEZI|nr:hypothetical protein CFIO01_05922 [Colletotrichum fioriniae PJ7]